MTAVADPATAMDVASRLRATFATGVTRPLAWRRNQLERMIALLEDNEAEVLAALAADLGKPRAEGFMEAAISTTCAS